MSSMESLAGGARPTHPSDYHHQHASLDSQSSPSSAGMSEGVCQTCLCTSPPSSPLGSSPGTPITEAVVINRPTYRPSFGSRLGIRTAASLRCSMVHKEWQEQYMTEVEPRFVGTQTFHTCLPPLSPIVSRESV